MPSEPNPLTANWTATAISKIPNTTSEITRLVGFKRFANLSMLVKIKTGSPNVR